MLIQKKWQQYINGTCKLNWMVPRGVHLVYFGIGTWDNGVFYMGVLIFFGWFIGTLLLFNYVIPTIIHYGIFL